MSYANYGPDFRVQSVDNLLAAALIIPNIANNGAIVPVNLIQTALGAEIPLVLGEGTWSVNARCEINPDDGAFAYQYMQSALYVAGNLVAASAPIFGAAVLGAGNVLLYLSISYVLYIPPGATRSLTYRLLYNGNPGSVTRVNAGYSQIVAHKLSA